MTIDFSALEALQEENTEFSQWRSLFEFKLWGVTCLIRDGRTQLRFRLNHGFDTGLRNPILIDLVCDGVIESEVDWRITELLHVSSEEKDGHLLVYIQDDLTRYVSHVLCAKSWIEVVTESDATLDKFAYIYYSRYKIGEMGIVPPDENGTVIDGVPEFDKAYTFEPQRFINHYFGERTS